MWDGCPTIDSSSNGSWGGRLFDYLTHEQLYNATWDKELFSDRDTKKFYTPAMVLDAEPADFEAAVLRMRERGFWPVFEGKHVEQFLVGVKPVRWWLSVTQAKDKYSRGPRDQPTLVFRETASNTNERTCIAAMLPAGSAGSHTLSGALFEHVDPDAAACVFNSLVFDWALRLRTAGTHVSFTYMRPMPVPPAEVANRLPRVLTQLAWERGIEHVAEDETLWPDLWATNRAVAEAYGLGPEDFAHILASFPVFARKRPEFHAYLRDRLGEWMAEVTPISAGVHTGVGAPPDQVTERGTGSAEDADRGT
jgi:hypothetical protein